jgi:glycosyltransferase involved in cell wall biosynthesis
MGRQVAGKEFLDAYLQHSRGEELLALVSDRESLRSLTAQRDALAAEAARRPLRAFAMPSFHEAFLANPPAQILHQPSPPEERFAWARRLEAPDAFALSGVTHTLSSLQAARVLQGLVTGPFESYDALICTSRDVTEMVRTATQAYADYLRELHGGNPALRLRLETIPLGVDLTKHRPATPQERTEWRKSLGIDDDAVVVLYVGRLSFHAKAHPFPMFDGLARAARLTGKKVHLLLAGWAASPSIAEAFRGGARVLAPGITTTLIDGTSPANRSGIWHAADVFASLSDNIQETFGLAITEAMARGLPVVASDWAGYRDQVIDGQTGMLIPTRMVRGVTPSAASRHLVRETDYDRYLAESSQAVVVEPGPAADAFARLIAEPELRLRMGRAGLDRASKYFSWPRVIREYERLWQEQDEERRSRGARVPGTRRAGRGPGPAIFPAPEHAYAGYPTSLLDAEDRVVADPDARERLAWLLGLPITSHSADRRLSDPATLREALDYARTPCSIGQLDEFLDASDTSGSRSRATTAWMLKYGLLHPCGRARAAETPQTT